MADKSPIEWTEATWNPVVGCSILSPGCTNCYAMRMAERIERMSAGAGRSTHYAGTTKPSKAGPVWTGKMALAPSEILLQPLKWKRPRMIFVNSMSDLFHESVPDEWIDMVFAVMAMAPQHTFQVLTKRASRMREYVNGQKLSVPILGAMPLERVHLEAVAHMDGDGGFWDELKQADGNVYSLYCSVPWPLPNVWLGVSTERQQEADERVPDLLATPAAIRFISAEPLLGPIDMKRWLPAGRPARRAGTGEEFIAPHFFMTRCEHCGWIGSSELCGTDSWGDDSDVFCPACSQSIMADDYPSLDQVIVGGESGPNARPMHPAWPRQIRDQCAHAGVAFFFKQWGAWKPICEMSEAQVDACYRSNRKAKDNQDQDILDELYGRTRIVDSVVLHSDGTQHDTLAPMAFAAGAGAMTMFEIGKKRAGRLLGGREHNGMPQPREIPAL